MHTSLHMPESQHKCVAAVWKPGRVTVHQLDLMGCEGVWLLEGEIFRTNTFMEITINPKRLNFPSPHRHHFSLPLPNSFP